MFKINIFFVNGCSDPRIIAFAQATEERANIPEERHRDFYLFADELQDFTNDGFAAILSDGRKMWLTIANQFYRQFPDALKAAIAGNVGTVVAFRVGPQDAPLIDEMRDHHTPRTLSSTPNHQAWLRLMVEGVPTEPIPIKTMAPPTFPAVGSRRFVLAPEHVTPGRRLAETQKTRHPPIQRLIMRAHPRFNVSFAPIHGGITNGGWRRCSPLSVGRS